MRLCQGAVGIYTCSGDNCGRALGRYQFMSYNSYATRLIKQKTGGDEFLKRMQSGSAPTADELMQSFPPELQDQAFHDNMVDLIHSASQQIDPTTGQPSLVLSPTLAQAMSVTNLDPHRDAQAIA